MGTSRDSGLHPSRLGRCLLLVAPWRHRPPAAERGWIAAISAELEVTSGGSGTLARRRRSRLSGSERRQTNRSSTFLRRAPPQTCSDTWSNSISCRLSDHCQPRFSDSATSIIFTAESTEDIAVGDELRIESEVVTVSAVPADGSTGAAARTYSVTRGSNCGGAHQYPTDPEERIRTRIRRDHPTGWSVPAAGWQHIEKHG